MGGAGRGGGAAARKKKRHGINNLHWDYSKIPPFAAKLCNMDLLKCHNGTSLKVNKRRLSPRAAEEE